MNETQDEKEKFAFVVMPFAPEFEDIYNDLIVPALELAGYEVRRADSTLDQENILKSIIRNISQADLIVAELTSLNSNVMYELGIAHALGRPTVMLAQSIDEIPFDLQSYRIIVYSTRYDEAKKLKDQLEEVASKHCEGKISFGNPVSDFASDRQQISKKTETVPESEEETLLETAEEELGILDYQVEAEKSIMNISSYLEQITEKTMEFNQKTRTRTEEINVLRETTTAGSSMRVHRSVRGMALDMIRYSQDISPLIPEFNETWDVFMEKNADFFSKVKIENAEDRDGMLFVRSKMEEFKDSLTEALTNVRSFHDSTQALKGVSKDLNVGVRQLTKTLEEIIEILSIGESYTARMINLINEQLGIEEEEISKGDENGV